MTGEIILAHGQVVPPRHFGEFEVWMFLGDKKNAFGLVFVVSHIIAYIYLPIKIFATLNDAYNLQKFPFLICS